MYYVLFICLFITNAITFNRDEPVQITRASTLNYTGTYGNFLCIVKVILYTTIATIISVNINVTTDNVVIL